MIKISTNLLYFNSYITFYILTYMSNNYIFMGTNKKKKTLLSKQKFLAGARAPLMIYMNLPLMPTAVLVKLTYWHSWK